MGKHSTNTSNELLVEVKELTSKEHDLDMSVQAFNNYIGAGIEATVLPDGISHGRPVTDSEVDELVNAFICLKEKLVSSHQYPSAKTLIVNVDYIQKRLQNSKLLRTAITALRLKSHRELAADYLGVKPPKLSAWMTCSEMVPSAILEKTKSLISQAERKRYFMDKLEQLLSEMGIMTDEDTAKFFNIELPQVSDLRRSLLSYPDKQQICQLAIRLRILPSYLDPDVQEDVTFDINDFSSTMEELRHLTLTQIKAIQRIVEYSSFMIAMPKYIPKTHINTTPADFLQHWADEEEACKLGISCLSVSVRKLLNEIERDVQYYKGGAVTLSDGTRQLEEALHYKSPIGEEEIFYFPYHGWNGEWKDIAELIKRINKQGIAQEGHDVHYYYLRRVQETVEQFYKCFLGRQRYIDSAEDRRKVTTFTNSLKKLTVKLRIAAVFRRIMGTLNMTSAEFGRHMAIPPEEMSRYLNFKGGCPSDETITKWSARLGLSPSQIGGISYNHVPKQLLDLDIIAPVVAAINKLNHKRLLDIKKDINQLYTCNQINHGEHKVLEPLDDLQQPDGMIPC